jgi:hypothetical protein
MIFIFASRVTEMRSQERVAERDETVRRMLEFASSASPRREFPEPLEQLFAPHGSQTLDVGFWDTLRVRVRVHRS